MAQNFYINAHDNNGRIRNINTTSLLILFLQFIAPLCLLILGLSAGFYCLVDLGHVWHVRLIYMEKLYG